MPQVRKLAPEEAQSLEDKGKGTRKLTEERYDRAFAEFEAGDYGELIPDAGENRLTSPIVSRQPQHAETWPSPSCARRAMPCASRLVSEMARVRLYQTKCGVCRSHGPSQNLNQYQSHRKHRQKGGVEGRRSRSRNAWAAKQ
jgi:hypothetical protein